MGDSHSVRYSAPQRLGFRIGRWLLKPVTRAVLLHYQQAADRLKDEGEVERAERCEYIFIGAAYVGRNWPHEGGHV